MTESQVMKPLTLKDWVIATRPWSFPASAMPVIVTLAYLYWQGYAVEWGLGVWALINIVIFHAAGNTWSDYYDYRKGVDAQDTFGAKTLTSGQFMPQQIRMLSVALLCVGLAGGMGLLALTGLPLLWIGIGGAICTLGYPYLKYRALGDVVIGVAYAWLPMWGTSYVAAGVIDPHVIWLAVPVGMITIAILHVNNVRDVATDRRASISTLAMKLGHSSAVKLYVFWVTAPYVCVIACAAMGIVPWWSLLTLLAAPMSAGCVKSVMSSRSDDTSSIAGLDERTAQLQLVFSLLFAASLVLATLI